MSKNDNTLLLVGGGLLAAYLFMPEKIKDAVGGAFPSIGFDLSGIFSGLSFPTGGGGGISGLFGPLSGLLDPLVEIIPDVNPFEGITELFNAMFDRLNPPPTPDPAALPEDEKGWYESLHPITQNVVSGTATVAGGYAAIKLTPTIIKGITPAVTEGGILAGKAIASAPKAVTTAARAVTKLPLISKLGGSLALVPPGIADYDPQAGIIPNILTTFIPDLEPSGWGLWSIFQTIFGGGRGGGVDSAGMPSGGTVRGTQAVDVPRVFQQIGVSEPPAIPEWAGRAISVGEPPAIPEWGGLELPNLPGLPSWAELKGGA